jgi:hypothetical protein
VSSGKVKGAILFHSRRYIEENGGEERWLALQQRLEPVHRALTETLLLPAVWYPVSLYNDFVATLLWEHPGSRGEFQKLVRYVAERDFSTTYKLLMRVATPELLLGRSGSLWNRYFDAGSVSIVSATSVRGTSFWKRRPCDPGAFGTHLCGGRTRVVDVRSFTLRRAGSGRARSLPLPLRCRILRLQRDVVTAQVGSTRMASTLLG